MIRRSRFVVAVAGLTGFMIGLAIGYFTFSYAFNRGFALARGVAGVQSAPAVQRQVQPNQGRIDVSVDDDPYVGPKNAPVTIVEFSDFQCPFCADFHDKTYGPLMQKYNGKVRFVYRDFPLDMHPDAEKAAEAANCALQQGPDKYWALHAAIFKNQRVTGVGLAAIATMAIIVLARSSVLTRAEFLLSRIFGSLRAKRWHQRFDQIAKHCGCAK